jgi:hypothetical protein
LTRPATHPQRRASDRDSTQALLWILDDLTYLIECAALDYTGEGRYELDKLCERVETDPRYRCADSELIAARLRHALEKYTGARKNVAHGHSLLITLSRDLWKRVHPSHGIGGTLHA